MSSCGVLDSHHRGHGFNTHPGPIAINLEQVANYCVLRETQPPILSRMGCEYQPMGGDAVWLGVKAGMVCVW